MPTAKFVQYNLIVLALIEFAIAIDWFAKESGHEPLSLMVGGLATLIGAFFAGRSDDGTAARPPAQETPETGNTTVGERGVYIRGNVSGSIVTGDSNMLGEKPDDNS